MLLLTKNSELPLGTNIAQQAFCYMSKTFDFHSRRFISLWFLGNKSEALIDQCWLWRSGKIRYSLNWHLLQKQAKYYLMKYIKITAYSKRNLHLYLSVVKQFWSILHFYLVWGFFTFSKLVEDSYQGSSRNI